MERRRGIDTAVERAARAKPATDARATRAGAAARRAFWLAFAVALAPLLLLVVLQYGWLLELQRTSRLADGLVQQRIVQSLAKEGSVLLSRHGEKVLDIPGAWLRPSEEQTLASTLVARASPGARRYFLVTYEARPRVRLLDLAAARFVPAEAGAETAAILRSCEPFTAKAQKGLVVEKARLQTDERDPSHRIMLYPVLDDTAHLLGVAGLVVDERRFVREVLPQAIENALPVDHRLDYVVWVLDRTGRVVLPPQAVQAPVLASSHAFPLLFRDWTIGIEDRRAASGGWRPSPFAVNLTLALALAVVLLAGVVLSLRTAAREIRLSAMKSDFVSNVSHELRTPISSIRVFGELMRLGRVTDPDRIREYGGLIESEGHRLTRLIDNILDFSRIESGRKAYTFARVDLVQVVRDAVSAFDAHLCDPAFLVVVETPTDPLLLAAAEAGALDQAIRNLLDNAVKYSGEGRQITVRLRRQGEGAVVEVADRGIGIPAGEQRRIFDRFHRVSTGLVHDVRGVGLGLSIVHHIVSAHGGRIEVASEPGRGSTFAMHLPGALPHGTPATPVTPSEEATQSCRANC